jgi:hypothetical protein
MTKFAWIAHQASKNPIFVQTVPSGITKYIVNFVWTGSSDLKNDGLD